MGIAFLGIWLMSALGLLGVGSSADKPGAIGSLVGFVLLLALIFASASEWGLIRH